MGNLRDIEQIADGRHVMNTMTAEDGHSQIRWDPSRPPEVEAARNYFKQMTKEGYTAFTAGENGEPGEPIHEFDPAQREIVMVPRIVGG